MTRVAAGLVLWTVVAVPAALLLGRVLGATRDDIADEAAAYLRQVAPSPPRRRRGRVAAVGLAVTIGLATHAAASEHLAGTDDAGDAAATSPDAEDRRVGAGGAVVGRPGDADLPPVGQRERAAEPRETAPAADPGDADGQPEGVPAPVPGAVIPDTLGLVCAVVGDTLGVRPLGACEATATAATTDQVAGDDADGPAPRLVLPSPLP